VCRRWAAENLGANSARSRIDWHASPHLLGALLSPESRDDFSPATKRRLALRVCHRCSFPGCDAPTAGPSDEANDAVSNVGVAAHISAAASGPGARRYVPSVTPEQRASIDNAIWLCQTHGKLVDSDESTWTVEALQKAKADAERRAKTRVGQQETALGNAAPSLAIEGAVCVYIKSYRAAYVAATIVNTAANPVTIKHAKLMLGGVAYAPNKPRENLALRGCDWFGPGPLRIREGDALVGAWYFGWSFAGGGSHIEAVPGAKAQLTLAPVVGDPIVVDVEFIHPDAEEPVGSISPPLPAPSSTELAHDKLLFQQIDLAFPEAWLVSFADRIQTSDDYTSSGVEPFYSLIELARLESNRFCGEHLNIVFADLVGRVHKLLGFLSTNCFVYPARQDPNSDTQFALNPDLNIDRGSRSDLEPSKRYSELQAELDTRVRSVRDAYSKYRAAIRHTLHL
jgi:hypothetical protein